MKAIRTTVIIGLVALAYFSFTKEVQEEWVVPEKYVNMKNPTDPSVDLDIGKSLYSKHCKSCHGKEGYGDGPKAADQTEHCFIRPLSEETICRSIPRKCLTMKIDGLS